jgi:beta-glucanase (GH16 family)
MIQGKFMRSLPARSRAVTTALALLSLTAALSCRPTAPAPAPAPAGPVTLAWATPPGATLGGNAPAVELTGQGFVNVEIFHGRTMIARAAIAGDGRSARANLDTARLPGGAVTLSAHAWNSPAGTSFTSEADAGARTFTVTNGSAPTTATTTAGPAPSTATTRPAPTTARPAPPATNAPSPGVPSGYELVFSDEFNGAELDTSKWWTRYVYENGNLDRLNDEIQVYREAGNHVMTGSSVKLMAHRKPKGNGIDFESGMLRSKTTVRNGYFEARVKMPKGIGAWPAFWLNAEDASWPPEIDIFEFVNNGKDDTANMIHFNVIDRGAQSNGGWTATDAAFNQQYFYWKAPYNFPDAFHTVGALWTDSGVTFYVDGKAIATKGYKWVHNDGRDAGMAHILLNFALGGQWAGRYGVAQSFPDGFEIDYVRAYQKAGDKRTGRSTIGRDLCPSRTTC